MHQLSKNKGRRRATVKAPSEQKRRKQASISKECKMKDKKARKGKWEKEGKAGIKKGKKQTKENRIE